MINPSDISVVVPAFNEEESIVQVLTRLKAVSPAFDIIVVSDGSQDRTAALAKEHGARVIEHPYNIGNGAAIKTGALASNRDLLIFIDADLQHPPEDIPRLLEFLPQYDLVIGARTGENDTHWLRNFGNRLLKWVAELISGFTIDDLTSGFRAVKRRDFLSHAHLYPLRYSYPTTSTLAFLCAGQFVKFVPVSGITKRTKGTSKIRPLADGMRFLHIIVRIVMTFHPQKVFLPLSLIPLVSGVLVSIYQLTYTGGIRSSGIILLISAVVIFLNGMLAEQVAEMRRNLKLRIPPDSGDASSPKVDSSERM